VTVEAVVLGEPQPTTLDEDGGELFDALADAAT
jgi:hypothetical protein